METYVSQRPEDSRKEHGRMETRSTAVKSKESVGRIGPPARKSGEKSKTVTFNETETEIPRSMKRVKEDVLKSKSLPYVDVPPIRSTERGPLTDPVNQDQIAKFGPVYKSRAPVEVDVDIEDLVAKVLDLEVSVPLRNLAGVSGAIQKEIRKQVTRARVLVEEEENVPREKGEKKRQRINLQSLPLSMYSITTEVSDEIPEGHLVASDPLLQYLAEHKDEIPTIVAPSSVPLRSVYMTVNRLGVHECLIDNGSMIASMAKDTAVHYGLTWDPSLRFNMESASGHLELTLGLARNVRFSIAGIEIFLQVHILENPPYKILLGRPFEAFASCTAKTNLDGSTELTLTDPNSKKVTIVPTYERGKGPEELQKQLYQDF